MNSAKTLKNSIISVFGEILTLLLQFVNRRIFVTFLDIEYLGYHSVFGNIFSILSVAELGIGGIISFHLYREIVTHNKQEIGKLMYLYKWVYRIIAAVVTVLGLVACIFVPYIVKDSSRSIGYLYIVYFLQLASMVAGYFLSYRRTIYAADQKEYVTIEIDLFANIIVQVIQLTLLAIFKNYLLYLAIQLSITFFANVLIMLKSNKDYPYLKEKYTVTKEDINKRNMIPDIKNFLVHKIAYAVYGGTDNIVISALCGIRNVALYGNYFLIQKGVMNVLFYRLLNPVQAAIGNIVYADRKKEDLWKQFEMFDVFSFFFASYISAGFLVFFQPAIQIWLGSTKYLLPYSFVIAFSLTIYLLSVWEIVCKYRSVFGDYKQDRNCMLVSAVLNIIVSVSLAKPLGVTGVQIGTFAGFLPIAYGRIRFVVKGFFGQSVKKYLAKHAGLFAVVILEGATLYFLTRNMPVTLVGILLRFLLWGTIPLAVDLLIYFRSPHFKDMCGYFKNLLNIVMSKAKQKK